MMIAPPPLSLGSNFMTASYRFDHDEREKYLSRDKLSLTVSVPGKILLKKSPKPSGS